MSEIESEDVLVRALLISATAAIVLSPMSAGALQAFEVTRLPANSFVVMKVLYGALVTLLIGPPVIRAALAVRPSVRVAAAD